MDSTSINQKPDNVVQTTTSRLPAGSTLEIAPGVHVPHPHAEVNLPGVGDPRLGDTKAVTEFRKPGDAEQAKYDPTVGLEQKPLADEVKPKVVTVAKAATESPSPKDETVQVEEPTLAKTV